MITQEGRRVLRLDSDSRDILVISFIASVMDFSMDRAINIYA